MMMRGMQTGAGMPGAAQGGMQGGMGGFPMMAPGAGAGYPAAATPGATEGAAAPPAAPMNSLMESAQRARFATQLGQLSVMGFTNESKCIQALLQHNGRVDAAIDHLLA